MKELHLMIISAGNEELSGPFMQWNKIGEQCWSLSRDSQKNGESRNEISLAM